MRGRLVRAAAALAAVGATALAAASGKGPRESEPQGPLLILTAVPRIGFPPLEVTLTATLRGVPRDDPNFCHVDRIWTVRAESDSRGRVRASSERPRCHHPPEQSRVEMRYYADKVLRVPGVYHLRLTLEPKTGPPLRSNPVTVQVLSGR